MVRMFIRQTRTNNSSTGEEYLTYRLVRGQRIAGKVRQVTILNLGRHFPVLREDWPLLCSRIEQLLAPQTLLCPIECSDAIERTAQRYFAKLVGRSDPSKGTPVKNTAVADLTPTDGASQTPPLPSTASLSVVVRAPDIHEVDIDSIELSQPRSVGVEHVALHAIDQLGLVEKLTRLNINGVARACILGNLIGRMAAPASERATWGWLKSQSALGELLDVDFNDLSHINLYRASDVLMKYRQDIENHVFNTVTSLFSLGETVTLYDLTNTYFEGEAGANPKAHNGHSKENRTDCPLVTLGLVLDGSGFVRQSKTFEGNISEGKTLGIMLTGLQAPAGALVIMDAGIATQGNIDWLIENKYRYLVVRRSGARQFDETLAVETQTAGGEIVRLQKKLSADGKEIELYCHSKGREEKEVAMVKRFCDKFEAGLKKIAEGLASDKPHGEKRVDKLNERIGRLKQKSAGASQHYQITLTHDKDGKKATALIWNKELVQGTMATHPGVYCLRTNILDWDEQKLWQTYSTLTDIESVFRSLKSELGLRPVFHQKEGRTDGHIFITVLAYQCVQVIRKRLKESGINDSWATLRKTLQVQQRVTTSMRASDGRMIHVRKSTKAEPLLMRIYQTLGIDAMPGSTKKLIV